MHKLHFYYSININTYKHTQNKNKAENYNIQKRGKSHERKDCHDFFFTFKNNQNNQGRLQDFEKGAAAEFSFRSPLLQFPPLPLHWTNLKGLRIAKMKIYIFYLPPILSECNPSQCHAKHRQEFRREIKNINFHFCYALAAL